MNTRAAIESLPQELVVKVLQSSNFGLAEQTLEGLNSLLRMSPLESYRKVVGQPVQDFGDVVRFRQALFQESQGRKSVMESEDTERYVAHLEYGEDETEEIDVDARNFKEARILATQLAKDRYNPGYKEPIRVELKTGMHR